MEKKKSPGRCTGPLPPVGGEIIVLVTIVTYLTDDNRNIVRPVKMNEAANAVRNVLASQADCKHHTLYNITTSPLSS